MICQCALVTQILQVHAGIHCSCTMYVVFLSRFGCVDAMSAVILILRTYALWEKNRKILWVLVFAFVVSPPRSYNAPFN